MKKRKLLFLLLALLSLALVLSACDDKGKDGAQEGTQHELLNYFVLDNGIEGVSFTEISEMEGEIVEIDDENNLLSVKLQDLDNHNNVIETVAVYDITTGTKIFEDSVTSPLYADHEKEVTLAVNIDYPVIRVCKTSYSEDDEKDIYDVTYYFAKENSEIIKKTDDNYYARKDYENGLVCYTMGDEDVWINKDMEVVRTVSAVASNGYDIVTYNCEYEDYLYTWTEEELFVFDTDGLCCATYKISHDGFLNIHVLNNGNILVQDLEEVDSHTAFDFEAGNDRYVMTSYIMNYTDGEMTEVEFDYFVASLQTSYYESYGDEYTTFPFELKDGVDNQAYIYKIANGSVARASEYVAINNDLEILYTVKNNTEGSQFFTASVINQSLYHMYVREGGTWQGYVFDLDGNKIAAAMYGMNSVTGKYIVTENAIYDHKMNVIYDLSDTEFANRGYYVDAFSDTVYLNKYNFVTGKTETYVYDEERERPILFTDGVEEELADAGWGYYVKKNPETDKYTLYNTKGDALLVTLGAPTIHECEDAFVVTASFEGKTLVYILK